MTSTKFSRGPRGSVWRSFRRAFGLSLSNHKQLSFRDRDWFNYGLGSQISRKWKRYEQLAKEELKLKYVKTRKYCVQEKLQETFIVLVSCIPWFRWQQGYVLSSIDTSELKFISQMVLNATFFLFKQCDLAFDHLILLCKHVTERFSIRFTPLR